MRDRLKNVCNDSPASFLDEKERNEVAEYLGQLVRFGISLDEDDVAEMLMKRLKGNKLGTSWFYRFLHEYKALFKIQSKEETVNVPEEVENNVLRYHNNLQMLLARVPEENVLCYDEISFADNLKKGYNLIERSDVDKQIRMNSGISTLFSATLKGILPCFVIYKSDHLDPMWCNGGPPNAVYRNLDNGKVDHHAFEQYFFSIIEPWARNLDGCKIVIGRNLIKHFSPKIVDSCNAHNIVFTSVPPQTIEVAHPLEETVMKVVKKSWKVTIADWKQWHNTFEGYLPKEEFPKLLQETVKPFNEPSFKDELRKSFEDCGILPPNPTNLLKRFQIVKHKLLAQQHIEQMNAKSKAKRDAANQQFQRVHAKAKSNRGRSEPKS